MSDILVVYHTLKRLSLKTNHVNLTLTGHFIIAKPSSLIQSLIIFNQHQLSFWITAYEFFCMTVALTINQKDGSEYSPWTQFCSWQSLSFLRTCRLSYHLSLDMIALAYLSGRVIASTSIPARQVTLYLRHIQIPEDGVRLGKRPRQLRALVKEAFSC